VLQTGVPSKKESLKSMPRLGNLKILIDFVARAPFLIRSVQVGGGSECMSEVEDAVQN
jgi:hypothetical protein